MYVQLATSSRALLVSASMVQSGPYTMFLDSSFGHPYRSVYVLVLVQYLAKDVVPPAVKQNVSTVMSGNVQVPIVQGRAGDESAMTNTIAASVLAVSPVHTVICKLSNEQKLL